MNVANTLAVQMGSALVIVGITQCRAERAQRDGKPGDTPPSKKIGLYRNALAKIMAQLDMGTKRYRTVIFWQRVKLGEATIPMRQRTDRCG